MASEAFEIADRYVQQFIEFDPTSATFAGLGGGDHRLTDVSPEGWAERVDYDRQVLRTLDQLTGEGGLDTVDRRAVAVMRERLEVAVADFEAGTWFRDLNTIASSLQAVVEVMDLAEVDSAPGRQALVERLEAVPAMLAGYRRSLQVGLDRDDTVALRQVRRAVEQTRARSDHFVTVAQRLDGDDTLGQRARRAGVAAATAYGELGRWLADAYAPRARAGDGVGLHRYRVAQRSFLGADPDPAEAYAWGWHRVHELRSAMEEVAQQITPGEGVAAALHHVEHDSDFAAYGVEAFRDWAQQHVDHMMDVLGRAHFDLSPAIRRCEVRVSPPGGSTAAHYTGPSEDGRRPGIYWQPDLQRDRYPLWNQVTTANHEAVPGHHLQIAQVVLGGAPMSRFQRMLAWTSGHGEGWALYAERLCHELGLLDRPEAVLGYLAAAQLRAVRVVIDIGVHCGFPLPVDAPIHGGEPWSWEVAFQLARLCTGESPEEMTSEIDRYFGWPGQAPSYALGEREWLATRDEARRRATAAGDTFDLAVFHATALNLGSMGLSTLRREVLEAQEESRP
jgi:uncharacterized protein (DUF885 family)